MSSIYDQHKPTGDNDLYLKVNDGDKVKLRVASEPAISVYKAGQKPRYSWVVFTREHNGKTVNKPQILTKGSSVYGGIANLVEEWGIPQEFDIVLKRVGATINDTEYSVTPVKQSDDLTKDQLAEIDKVDLLQATKGKWLADYVEDNELPEPITISEDEPTLPTKGVGDEPINLEDIQF